jgi:hypothetical protein
MVSGAGWREDDARICGDTAFGCVAGALRYLRNKLRFVSDNAVTGAILRDSNLRKKVPRLSGWSGDLLSISE